MPLILSLPAPGSSVSFARPVTRISHLSIHSIGIQKRPQPFCFASRYPTLPAIYHRRYQLLALTKRPAWALSYPPSRISRSKSVGCGARDVHVHDSSKISSRNSPDHSSGDGNDAESAMDILYDLLGIEKDLGKEEPMKLQSKQSEPGGFRGQLSLRSRKFLRPSRPTQVLASLTGSARELYLFGPHEDVNLGLTSPCDSTDGSVRELSENARLPRYPTWLREPASLYSILGRYLHHHTSMQAHDLEFVFTDLELEQLHLRGYTSNSVGKWASCLMESRSNVAAKIFDSDVEVPPFFLLLLFLRRKHLRTSALGVVMRHIDRRTKVEPCSWESLKILVVRLLRHSRERWPESLHWIASLFVTESTRLHTYEGDPKALSTKMLSDLTQFCNSFLLLLSLPTALSPILYASYQEKAQFSVLQYMASASPAILVNQMGFRSVTRTQLAHPKTEREREWAQLKGPGWPPWKENRTAMDEDKGYEFGVSRASKILHRMSEAGYGSRAWEELAEVYAGWDSDLSPTIQTRTSMPRFSTQYRNQKHLRILHWAGRIRTTRTRREAWACFLAHESTNIPAHQDIYHAMFEKLYYPIVERAPTRESQMELEGELQQSEVSVLPGDMKEVLPDPKSPLHHVFLSEPVPTYAELYHRMHRAQLRPSKRLLAFLLETWPDFTTMPDILADSKEYSDSGLALLVAGDHDNHDGVVSTMPDYMFAAFIRFLCRFGRFNRPPPVNTHFMAPEQHAFYFKHDKNYLLEYAYTLLVRYKPKYRPAWAVYMDKLVQQKGVERGGYVIRYKIMCGLLGIMEEIDIDVDDEIFRLMCIATFYTVQSIDQGLVPIEEARSILVTGSSRLRTLFHSLVSANADMQQPTSTQTNEQRVSPYVPGPAELHAYVRALGVLRDYEGLYSFSTWLTRRHVEVTARAEARPSGSKLLFRMLVALRAAVDGEFEVDSGQERGASAEIAQLVRMQIESMEKWGGWPAQEHVDMYLKGNLKSPIPFVRGQ